MIKSLPSVTSPAKEQVTVVTTGVGVGDTVGVGVGVFVGTAVGDGDGVGVEVAVGTGVGVQDSVMAAAAPVGVATGVISGVFLGAPQPQKHSRPKDMSKNFRNIVKSFQKNVVTYQLYTIW